MLLLPRRRFIPTLVLAGTKISISSFWVCKVSNVTFNGFNNCNLLGHKPLTEILLLQTKARKAKILIIIGS